MATQSFYEMLEIDTPEKVERLIAAYEAAKKRSPLVFEGKSVFDELKEGEEYLRNNPL
jgi:hypothetical protein